MDPPIYPKVIRPFRESKSALLRKDGSLERAVELSARQVRVRGGLLLLVDSDDDCPVTIARTFRERMLLARGDLPMAAVIAVVEFEAWFLAAATSLAGVLDMRPDLSPPSMPEQVHDAKGWIKRNRLTGTYQPTIDQPKFAYHFSLAEAQSSRSFRKCYKEIRRILGGE
jgi:uncharacterized protein DUF4276